MATEGKLATSYISATATYTTVYTVPAGVSVTANISVVNFGTTKTGLRLAITDDAAATPPNKDIVERGLEIAGNGGVYQRMGVVMSAGEKVVAYTTTEAVSVRVEGFERDV